MEENCPEDSPFSKLFLPVMGSPCQEFVDYLAEKQAKLAKPAPKKEISRLFYRKMRTRAARVTYKKRLMYDVFKMMYVSGETAEPSSETTGMVEEIVRQQVIEMVCGASMAAPITSMIATLIEIASYMYRECCSTGKQVYCN
jgi:Transcription initiation factor IID, 18kD subunit